MLSLGAAAGKRPQRAARMGGTHALAEARQALQAAILRQPPLKRSMRNPRGRENMIRLCQLPGNDGEGRRRGRRRLDCELADALRTSPLR